MSRMRLLALGGCMMRVPFARARVNRFDADWRGIGRNVVIVGPPYNTLTFGEFFQTLDLYAGQKEIPAEIRPLCSIGPRFSPVPNTVLDSIDGVLVEPNTSNEIEFAGYYLNREPVLKKMLAPFKRISKDADTLAMRWYNQGIVAHDREAQRSLAAKLDKLMPTDFPNRKIVSSVLKEARGSRRDIRKGFQQLRERVKVPLGLVTYTFRYMPDGRPISWPAEFYDEVTQAAAELNVPICEPRKLIQEFGIATSLRPDLRHYQEEFMPRVAKYLSRFAHEVVRKRPAAKAAASLTIGRSGP